MKATLCAAVAAALVATPAAAQDVAGPVAAAVDQFGHSIAESMAGSPGIFVTAQGRAPMPTAAAPPMVLTVKGSGKTATEAVADRNARLTRIRSAANVFDVAMEVGETSYAITEVPDWAAASASAPDYDDVDAADDTMTAVATAGAALDPAMTRTTTASVQIELQRPNETRLPAFIDALAEAGVTDLNDGLTGMNLGQFQPFLSLLGLASTADPGDPVWNAATADGIARARAQAETIAIASGHRLGPIRYVSVLMRSHDGEDALVSVAVRFGFAE